MQGLGFDPIIMDIPNFPNYQISEDGSVYNKKTGRELNPSIDRCGYKRIHIRHNKKMFNFFVHRILCEMFIPNPLNKDVVDHIDRNRQNNKLNNLRWVSFSENSTNTKINKKNTSGEKGVSHEINCNYHYWRAHIKKSGETFRKCFPYTDEGFKEACIWRRQKELELHTIA